MRRTLGAALAAMLVSGAGSVAPAQNPIDQTDAQRQVFRDRDRDRDRDEDRDRYEAPRVPRGTDIPVTLDEDVPVSRDHIGDRFEGHITRDVTVNGEVVLVRGAPVEVKLVESRERAGAATLRLDRVHVNGDMYRVEADDAETDTDERGLGTLEKTAVGAGAGAVVGAVTGVGVLEGAIVGAGGGLAWGLLDGDRTRQVDDDTPLRFSLTQTLETD